MMKRLKSKIALAIVALLSLDSCVVVKEYQKINLNDPDMLLSSRRSVKFETTFQVYREGSAGANGGKSGGGCGCN